MSPDELRLGTGRQVSLSDEMGNSGSPKAVEVTTDRSVKSKITDTAIFDNLLTGTSDIWITRRKVVTDSLDGDTGWVGILKKEFADDTAAYRMFTGEKSEKTALQIMREYETGAGIDLWKIKDQGLAFLLYNAFMDRWGLSNTKLRILPQFDVNEEHYIDDLIPALYFESQSIQNSYRGR